MTNRQLGSSLSRWRRPILAVVLSLVVFGSIACVPKIPNVRPFAAETAGLYTASGSETQAVLTQYNTAIDLTTEVLEQSELRLEPGPREVVQEIKSRLEANKASFEDSSNKFDAVLQQAVVYSEKLAELAAAGEGGAAAADSLAESINGFVGLAGAAGPITGPVATILQKVSEFVTAMQARKSLREAADVAQGAVVQVGEALRQIHTDQLQRVVISLASDHDQLLAFEAGLSIIGYYNEANERRDQFYRRALLTLRLNDDGISGFCRSPETGEVDPDCINVRELEALAEVEGRLEALKPEFEEYQSKRNELRAWRELRRANGEGIEKAIDAWTSEHERVVAALNDGSGVSAFSLRAILAEIKELQ